jgi:hypothetical protein
MIVKIKPQAVTGLWFYNFSPDSMASFAPVFVQKIQQIAD